MASRRSRMAKKLNNGGGAPSRRRTRLAWGGPSPRLGRDRRKPRAGVESKIGLGKRTARSVKLSATLG
jgi:hypothetical protein